MRRLAPIAVAGLVLLLGVASCSSSSLRPPRPTLGRSVAEVTGFVSVPVMSGAPSGPVTVRVAGTKVSRLALLVSKLPSVAQSQVHCEEPLGLMYRIVFAAGLVAPSRAVVEGYRCDAGVTVTVAGKATSWRLDRSCRLLRAVRQVVPDRARATHALAIGCAS